MHAFTNICICGTALNTMSQMHIALCLSRIHTYTRVESSRVFKHSHNTYVYRTYTWFTTKPGMRINLSIHLYPVVQVVSYPLFGDFCF